jgi:integrase
MGQRARHEMTTTMKATYRLYRRGQMYYTQHNKTGKQESLRTTDKEQAGRLLAAKNESAKEQISNLDIAKVYLRAADPAAAKRTWQEVVNEGAKTKQGSTLERWLRAYKQRAFASLLKMRLIETRAEHFNTVFAAGTATTNLFLRRLHNLAIGLDWLSRRVIPEKRWPKAEFNEKRAVTRDEFEKIMGGERKPEWRAFYLMVWHTGGSQSDVANLSTENVDWEQRKIIFRRKKNGSIARVGFGESLEALLKTLPQNGLLFPNIARMKETDRAKAFMRRRKLVGVHGVSLHSFRHSIAERARNVGLAERFSMEILGHNSKAVHRAYARNAQPNVPDLESLEKANGKVVEVEFSRPAVEANREVQVNAPSAV